MKIRSILPCIMCAAVLTACSSSSETAAINNSGGNMNGLSYAAGASDSYVSYESYDNADYDYEYASDEAAPDTSSKGSSSGSTAAESLQKEMLVYSCSMNIDTLDFGMSVDSFKTNLDMYGGFIESENYSDGGSQNSWYNAEAQKWQTYTATVRIPSANYDAFCTAAAELGDLRSKNANVQNVSQEYSDLRTTLEIYEAKEERYIALLAEIRDDEYAVIIENELTDLQIQIAKLKTRMNKIQTDVAYSYVYITIKEVREYQAEPVKTDTFGDRLANVLKDAGSEFLEFLEGLLFFIIYTGPYIVLIGLIVFAVRAIIRANKKRKAKKAEKLFEKTNGDNEQK